MTELHSGFSASSPHVWEDVLADFAAQQPGTLAGAAQQPSTFAAERDQWIAATALRNFVEGDPLLDWLEMYGRSNGFVADDAQPGYREDLDFGRFVIEQGQRFELRIMELLAERAQELGHEIVEIHRGAQDLYDSTSFIETINAMAMGVPIISQGWLMDPTTRTFGAPDLLVRAEVLEELFPGTIPPEEFYADAPLATMTGQPGHYRAVDIKFTTLELLADGSAGAKLKSQAAQLWLYNQMLGAVQGFTPPAAFLLGRNWQSGSGKTSQRGGGAFERLAPVYAQHAFGRRGHQTLLSDTVTAGLEWRRRLAREGASWSVLPSPTVPELYPNASYTEDAPWHRAKRRLVSELGELTALPGVNPTLRNAAVKRGITSWRDPRASASELGVTAPTYALRCDAVLAANRLLLDENGTGAGAGGRDPRSLVLPAVITRADPGWRTPAPLDFYCDFETVSNLNDDFTALPKVGGQALIFQIGCGIYEPRSAASAGGTGARSEEDGNPLTSAPSGEGRRDLTAIGRHDSDEVATNSVVARRDSGTEAVAANSEATRSHSPWSFEQWTTELLSEPEELRIIDEWVAHMDAERIARGLRWDQVRIFHWSSAETSTLESAYSSARARLAARHAADPDRYPAADWPELPWYDLLQLLVRAEPITVAGAFGFGLKAIAKAMHAHGLIDTGWGDGLADGLGAMVGAWRCDATARQMGVPMTELALMREIAEYNEVDCRVMAEVLSVLRPRT